MFEWNDDSHLYIELISFSLFTSLGLTSWVIFSFFSIIVLFINTFLSYLPHGSSISAFI